MTIDEKVRHDLYEGLEKVVGETPAKLLMTAVPPFSWDNVATKGDISGLKGDISGLKGDILELRSELKSDIFELRSELKGDIAELTSKMNRDIDLLRDDNKVIHGELRDIRNEIKDVRHELVREHRWLLFQFLAVNLSMVTIVLAFVAIS
jgi:hypothetical protein